MLLCNHEKIAVQIAHGYAKASGKPMMAIVHNVVGLLHAPMGIYYAYIDRCPVFIVGATGPMDEKLRRPFIDWIHTAFAQGDVVRGFTKWDYQPGSIHGVPDSFARAYSIMMSEPQGPVYMVYDSAMQEAPLTENVPVPNFKVKVPSRVAPEAAVVEQAADMLVAAKNPLLLTEYAARMPVGFGSTVELAETIGASVYDINKRLGFPNKPSAQRQLSRRRFQRRRCGGRVGCGRLDARLAQAQHPDARDHRCHRAGLQVDRCRFRRYRDQQMGDRLQQASQLGSPRARRQRTGDPRADRGLPQAHRRQQSAGLANRRTQESHRRTARRASGKNGRIKSKKNGTSGR